MQARRGDIFVKCFDGMGDICYNMMLKYTNFDPVGGIRYENEKNA